MVGKSIILKRQMVKRRRFNGEGRENFFAGASLFLVMLSTLVGLANSPPTAKITASNGFKVPSFYFTFSLIPPQGNF
jgi:hypothetical protein